MGILLILTYTLVNIYILRKCYSMNNGVFKLPFMMAIVSLYIILPQLVSSYVQPDISENSFVDAAYILVSCNIAFYLGFNKGDKNIITNRRKYIYDIKIHRIKYLTILLAIIGLYFGSKNAGLSSIGAAANRSDFLINNLLANYLYYASLIALIIIIKNKSFDKVYTIILGSYFILQIMTIIAGARRSYVIGVVFLAAYLVYNIYPQYKKKIKRLLLIFFLIGGVISASILPIRKALETNSSLSQINFWNEFVGSFQKNVNDETGQDVYNCIKGIEYVKTNELYSFGADLWNGFIFNYIPKFLVGEEFKQSLKIETGYDFYVEEITHNITTMTGYFYAFSFLSYLGWIIFYIIGYISGIFFSKSNYSSLYKLLYLLLLLRVHSLFSHGIQYYISSIENFFILLLPIILPYIYKKKIVKKNRI